MAPARSSGTGRKEYIMTFLIVRQTQIYLVVYSICLLHEQGERSVWNSDRSLPMPVRLASWS
jgi:hypothetical protein